MKYAILAAGEGSRLHEEGVDEPKPLVKVGGEHLVVVLDCPFKEVSGLLVKVGGAFRVLLCQNAIYFLFICSIGVDGCHLQSLGFWEGFLLFLELIVVGQEVFEDDNGACILIPKQGNCIICGLL